MHLPKTSSTLARQLINGCESSSGLASRHIDQPGPDTAASGQLNASMFWRRHQVEQMTTLSRSTIYKRMAEGTFPKAVRLGSNSVGWLACEVQAWIRARIEESRCVTGKGAFHE